MSQLEIEEERQPCRYAPCTGWMTPELDGDLLIWACGTCHNEAYEKRDAGAEPDTCQVGVPTALQQRDPPSAPVFLGPTIARRPE